MVQYFTYLGTKIMRDGEVKAEIKLCITNPARTFRCLQTSIFQNPHFSVATK